MLLQNLLGVRGCVFVVGRHCNESKSSGDDEAGGCCSDDECLLDDGGLRGLERGDVVSHFVSFSEMTGCHYSLCKFCEALWKLDRMRLRKWLQVTI